MEKKTVRFGIIGYGFMGHIHARSLKKLDYAEVAAVCDNNEKQLYDIPEGAKVYTQMEDLIADPGVDAVIVSVPNNIHLETVSKAAKAGKDILCEKPAALSVREFDQMMEVVKAYGVKFTVHQQRRWDSDFRTAKKVYDDGGLGDVYTVQTKLYGFNGNMHDWHVINKEVDDYFKIILHFENGVTGEVELGTYFLSDKETWFERHWFIGGNRGSMYADGFHPKGEIVRTTRLLTNVPGEITMTAGGPTRSFGPPEPGVITLEELPEVNTEQIMYFDNFIKGLWGEEEFIVKPEEVRRILALMEKVRESARTKQSVSFKD